MEHKSKLRENANSGVSTAWISFGSNMGDRFELILQALTQIHHSDFVSIQKVSNIYETEPVGFKEQEYFLNGAAELSTTLNPIELLHFLLDIEKNLGRRRELRWGPRTIDLDILLHEDQIIKTGDLMIPHPEMTNRQFVLKPLAEIAVDVVVPGVNKSIIELLAEISDNSQIQLYKTSADVENKIFEV